MGIIYGKMNAYDQAIEVFIKAVELNPHDSELRFNLGLTYRKRGMREEAMREYQEAIKLAPDFNEAHKNLDLLRQSGCYAG
ncbi:MAG: tetratricopeptide repeat protein [Pseudomonadota bacterium]